MAARDVKPTRMELINTKRRIKLSQKGHKLLKMKRDGLIIEFFELMDRAKEVQGKLHDAYERAERSLAVAMAVEGSLAVRSAALSSGEKPTVELTTRNLMGVVVPSITAELSANGAAYGLLGTSPRIEDCAQAYKELTEVIVEAAEVETAIKRLLEEIERTKRRVNALEFKVIPELDEIKAFISLRLEEMERESLFGMKRIKAKNEAAEA